MTRHSARRPPPSTPAPAAGPARRGARPASSTARGTPAFVYIPRIPGVSAELELSEHESHYVARVCRLREGDAFDGADGRGCLARLSVVSPGARLRVRVESVESIPRPHRGWIASGAPEGSRDDWQVEKLAELGVERWIPIDCERGGWDRGGRRQDRWERLATAAMKQSRSAHRLEVAAPTVLADLLAGLPADASRWLASATGADPPAGFPPGPWIGAVGPAAGFTPGEEERLREAGFRPVRLAPGRLRSETATMALAALLTAFSASAPDVR